MPTGLICNEITNKVESGNDFSGEFEVLPNLHYQFFPDKKNPLACQFSVYASIEIDYSNGSNKSYLIVVSYLMIGLLMPTLEKSLFFANDAIEKINQHIKNELNSNKDFVVNHDQSSSLKSLEDALHEVYPRLS